MEALLESSGAEPGGCVGIGPQAQMSRQEQAQTVSRAKEGPVWPYLVFKELEGFLLALLSTHRSKATQLLSQAGSWGQIRGPTMG